MQPSKEPSLKRAIGAGGLALNAINLTVGSGIFILPAIVGEAMGAAGFVAYLTCGVLVILIMLCYAELGSRITGSGGSYAYVEKAFGPFAGFLVNNLFWFGFAALSVAAVINAMTDMLALWFPVLKQLPARVVLFTGVYGLLAWINIRGVKSGAGLAVAATIVKLAPLLLLVALGVFRVSAGNLVIHDWPSMTVLGDTSLVLFFAFLGTETALNMGGEIRNPQRSIPKGIFIGVAGILIVYLLLQFVAQGVLGAQLGAEKQAPLAALGAALLGPAGATLVMVTAVISMFGLLCGDMLASPRVLFAAGQDKLIPAYLGRVHPKFATPHWAIITYAAVSVVLASSGGFRQLASLASSSVLVIYLAVVAAMIRLRFKHSAAPAGTFRAPFGLLVPLAATAVIAWFLSHITRKELLAIGIFLGGLSMLYVVVKMVRGRVREGVVG